LNYKDKIFAVAPMMDWTDRHCRVFHRLLTRHALLYTEMVTAQAVRHGDRKRLLAFDAREAPVALQLGGSDPGLLAEAARAGENYGYAEINLNVGCPSDRVQSGRFGACLMAEPDLVARSIGAMKRAVSVPVTVKCRIGIDDQDAERTLDEFVACVSSAGCETFIIHARKAWLKGLSPKENREVPPLDYGRVHRLKRRFPHIRVVMNGGLTSLRESAEHLRTLDGLMMGREAYHNPWLLTEVDSLFEGVSPPVSSRQQAVEAMFPYIEQQMAAGTPLHAITRHMLGLFHAQPGGRKWRQFLSSPQAHQGLEQLRFALRAIEVADTSDGWYSSPSHTTEPV
jgi:tRNA-dihydrouridine synthase A